MYAIFNCIQNEHEARLVALAALISLSAAWATVLLLREMRDSTGKEKHRWRLATGVVSGFGIWATHFIAMLGYDPGVVAGYAVVPTLASLLLAMGAMVLGFSLANRTRPVPVPVQADVETMSPASLGTPSFAPSLNVQRGLGAVVVATGIAAMHYLGMSAVKLPGFFLWDSGYIALSLIIGVVPLFAALKLALDHRGLWAALGASALFVLGIVLIHFTGMTAVTVVPTAGNGHFNLLFSPAMMAVVIAGATMSILALAVVAAIFRARARIALMASEQEFSILVKGMRDYALYMVTPDGRVSTWNAGAERLTGYSADEAIGMHIREFNGPFGLAEGVLAEGLAEHELAEVREKGSISYESWKFRKDGTAFWAHATMEVVLDENGELRGYARIIRDMSQLKEDQDKLAALTLNLDAALSNMKQGLCLFDADEGLVLHNARAIEIFGVPLDKCEVGTSFEDVFRLGLEARAGAPVAPEDLAEVMERHRACLANPKGGTLTVPFTETCTLSISHRPVANGGWVTTFDDITERRLAERRIEHMALHDGLTGLPNRANYLAKLDAEILHTPVDGEQKVAVLGIDLDRFKEINDMHGHSAGDLVLKTLADRMTSTLHPGECIGRFGGDEFAAFKTYSNQADLDDFIDRLTTCLNQPLVMEDYRVHPGASIGVAVYPTDASAREQIVNNADLAMYRAKDTSGQQVCYYEQGMDEAARSRRRIGNDLRMAIERNELSIAYQVQRSVTTGGITGYEALLRWHHSQDGWISPADFIPIAEESGEILVIGDWVLRQACSAAAQWEEPWRVAVNISPVQLMHVDLFETVMGALQESGLPAHRLELEITETAIVADKLRALHILRRIKALGVTIAIDDFGTGYSSLDTLNSFPFDKIKIDKSFLLGSDSSHQARAIIRAVLALGRSLEVPVLAEGLETEEQLRLLQNEGCDQAQGYLWGRPELHTNDDDAPRVRREETARAQQMAAS